MLGDEADVTGLEVLVAAADGGELEHALRALGCVVLPLVSSAADALSLLRSLQPDVALLDSRLGRGAVMVLADRLTGMGVPFALLAEPGSEWRHDEPALACRLQLAPPLHPGAELRLALLSLR